MYFFKISCVFKQVCIFCSIGNMRAACVGSPRLLLPAGTCAFPRRSLHRLRPAPARTANNTGSLPKHADGLPRLFTIKGNAAPRRQCPRRQNTPEKRRRKGNGSANREERPGGEKNAALPGTGADDAEEGDRERERERKGGNPLRPFPGLPDASASGNPPHWTARVFALSFPRRCFSGGKRASSSFSDRRFLKGFHQRWQNLLFTAHHSRNPLFALLSGKCGIIRVTGIELHAEGPLDHPYIR